MRVYYNINIDAHRSLFVRIHQIFKMPKLINRSREFIITYPSTFQEQLQFENLKNFLITWANKKCKNEHYFFALCKEGPSADDELRRNHYHAYFNFLTEINSSEKSLDIQLRYKTIGIYKKTKFGKKEFDLLIHNEFYNDNTNFNDLMKKYEGTSFKIIEKAHPNVITKKDYGSSYDMLNYILKNPIELFTSEDYNPILQKFLKEKENKKKKEKPEEPDWKYYKENNFTLREIKKDLIKNHYEYCVKYYFKISPGLHFVFGSINKEYKVNRNLNFWIPKTIIDYIKNELKPYILNRNNKEWLENNRNNRPKSLYWSGPSKIGKTTFIRNCFDSNYYNTIFDGFESFNEDSPCIVIDDFHKKIKDFLPNWKCWLGCQTDFTINPKYGRRTKITWGHPCIFLSNFSDIFTNENNFDNNDLDYCNKNIIQYHTYSDRNLWDEPDYNFIENKDLVKINIGEFRKEIGMDDDNEHFSIGSEPPSERSVDISDNSINLLEEETTFNNGRLKRKINEIKKPHKRRRNSCEF